MLENAGKFFLVHVTAPDFVADCQQQLARIVDEAVSITPGMLLTLEVYARLQSRREATADRLRVIVVTIHIILPSGP